MPRSLSNFTARFGRVLVLLALFSAMAPTIDDAWGAGRIETFGPGSVDCQRLDESHVNCLLSALRITQDNKNVVAFDIAALPRKEQAIFRKWCSADGDSCIVTIKGTRAAPDATNLSTISSIHWTRLSAPRNQAAARALKN